MGGAESKVVLVGDAHEVGAGASLGTSLEQRIFQSLHLRTPRLPRGGSVLCQSPLTSAGTGTSQHKPHGKGGKADSKGSPGPTGSCFVIETAEMRAHRGVSKSLQLL